MFPDEEILIEIGADQLIQEVFFLSRIESSYLKKKMLILPAYLAFKLEELVKSDFDKIQKN